MKTFITLLFVFLIGIGVGFFFFNQKQEKFVVESVHKTIVTQLESIQDLGTAKMHLQKVVKGKKEVADLIPSWDIDDTIGKVLFEDEILMTVDAEVVAGIDIQELTQSGIVVHSDQSVSITIPAAKILYTELTQDTELNNRKKGRFTKGDDQMETKLRNAVKEDMAKEAINKGILEEAEANAKNTIRELMESTGIKIRDLGPEKELG